MIKINKKNMFLGLGIITTIGVVFGTSLALYFSAGDLKNISNKKEYLVRSSTELNLDGYYFDTSTSYGPAETKTPKTLMTSNLIRVQTTGETKFDKKNSAGELPVLISSKSRLVFDLGKEIVLSFQNSSGIIEEVIFNSDEADINPSLTMQNKPETIDLKSYNLNSINSDNFNNLLLGKAEFDTNGILTNNLKGTYLLKSLSFTVKDNAYWVDSNGDKTSYKINPRDFYYSFMRTWLFDTKFRRANGGSKELDVFFTNYTSTRTRFQEEDKYPNEYLFDLFGIDSLSMRNEEETIKNININERETEAFVISSNDSLSPNFSGMLKKIILDSYLIPAVSSEFIDKVVEESKNDPKYPPIHNLASKFGIYTYGQTRRSNLFASAYIPVSGGNNRIVFNKNKHFANVEFLKEENTLERIIFEHSISPTYNEQLFNNFFEGTVSEMPYTDLTQQQKIKIFGTSGSDDEAIAKGLLQTKQQNKSLLVQRTLLSTDPRKLNNGENYFFNNEYSKIMYGSTTEELRKGDSKTADTFFNGSGFELRTLLNASVNWYTFINNSWKGNKKLWLNHTAPDAIYNNISNKTPIDFYDQLNNIGYFIGDKKIEITEAQMQEKFNSNLDKIVEQYKSPRFDDIKPLITKLLNDNNVTLEKPLKWDIVYPWADGASQEPKVSQLYKVADTIKLLDERLQPNILIPNSRDEMLDTISVNKGITDFNGWGYDYDGIGSYLDGISHGQGISLLGAFSLYSNDANKRIQNLSPEFTKLSKAIKLDFVDLPVGLKVKDWVNLTNNENNNLESHFGQVNIGTKFAKFFASYQDKISDTEITNLIMELNIIAGFSMESDISINDPNAASLSLVLIEYFYPTTKSGILYLSDIRTGDKND